MTSRKRVRAEEECEQIRLRELIEKTCSTWWAPLRITNLLIQENVRKQQTTVKGVVTFGTSRKSNSFEYKGRGVVDALFKGLKKEFSQKFVSLNDIEFVLFKVVGDTKEANPSGNAIVEMSLKNSRYKELLFSETSYSLNTAAMNIVSDAIEFFINAEIAVIRTYEALKDAQERNRTDLIERFTMLLSELVSVTSYAETIKKEKMR